MADAVSNLAEHSHVLSGPVLGDSLAIDKKALLRPIPVDSPMTSLDIPWILSFINWHKDWYVQGREIQEKGEPYETCTHYFYSSATRNGICRLC